MEAGKNPILFVYGKKELQDLGTTLDDLRASYPTCYIVDCNEVGVELQNSIVHRSKNFQLQPNSYYLLKEPRTSTPLIQEVGTKSSPGSPSLEITTKSKEKNECPSCYTTFSYFSKRKVCKMCNQEYCLSCCKLKISYPPYIGNFTEPKLACKRCIPILFKLRHMLTDMSSLEKGIIPSSVIKILKKRKKSITLSAPFRKDSSQINFPLDKLNNHNNNNNSVYTSLSNFGDHFLHKTSLPSITSNTSNGNNNNNNNNKNNNNGSNNSSNLQSGNQTFNMSTESSITPRNILRRSILSSVDDTVITLSPTNNNTTTSTFNNSKLLKAKDKRHKRTKSHGTKEVDFTSSISSMIDSNNSFDQFGSFVPESIYSNTPTPSRFENGTFYTAGEGQLTTASKFLDPIFKIAYWTSGIKQGATFDRKLVEAAMKIVPGTTSSAKLKFTFPVPEVWPSLDASDEERTKLRNDAFLSYASSSNYNTSDNNNAPTPPPNSSEPVSVAKILTLGYVPPNYTYFSGSLPAVVYFHGGGFCLGHVHDSLYETICQTIAETVGCIVFAVEYRLAPEYKFPTQIEDCYAGLIWVYNHARELNVDVSRIAVAGDSAGGSLAAVIAQMARDRGGPPLCHQVLIYPCLTNPTTDFIESHRRYVNGPVLPRKTLFWMLEHLLPDKSLIDHPYVTPLNTASVIGLPSTTIINALHDPLRDHSELYARKLRSMGIKVTRTIYRRSPHAFFGVVGLNESDEALMEVCWGLATAFERSVSEF